MAIQKIASALWASSLLLSYSQARSIAHTSQHNYPTREIAGISVINTPLVQAAEDFASEHSSHAVYKHVMRSWLYGVLMLDANKTLGQSVDVEVHAVATLLHDLGWDMAEDSTLVSTDKRFEVDGAFAAREFIHQHGDAKEWDERKVQLVWDAIALHTERSIAYFKEVDVQVVSKGISLDFSGPAYGVSEEKYAAVAKAYPKNDLKDQINQTIIWLCATKPQTTYDTWMQPFGERYVEDYNVTGKQRIDIIFQNLTLGQD
ncbi:Ff.00g130760.m01.CDS01 [Fusarium sp. VM40]|nr:Ff.00g130760.m01.CDS01 [Fusarium sp. VM40]